MKSNLIGKFAVSILSLSCVLSLSALAQTTDEGAGPSEQPSAPMEVGQSQPDYQESNAQPTEAQPGGPSGEEPAQSDQGVGRISLIHGDVSTQRGDSGDWSAATLNQPLLGGDKISTGDSGRAEVQLDFANTLRLGHNTKANVASLTHKDIQIQLSEGIANYTVSKDSELEPEIDTPNVSLHPSHHDGVFRIEVRPDGDTIVIVRKGEAQISTPQGSTELRSGDMATIRGDSNSAQYKIASAPDRDDWDRWNSDRDHIIRDASSWGHTNRRYTGTHDLDSYGHWRHVDDYGDVWYPDQDADWAPYRNGNWVYEPHYGWTWVGGEPWGWAPYHYGRWMYAGGGWGWWPGPVYAGYNPFWAPAYVSFWGWGGGWGFGVGFGGWGGFGWLPLGPCDWFHPWWGGYRGRFGSVNVTNINITNINNNRWGGFRPLHPGNRFSNVGNLHNDHVFRAMSAVNAGRFGAGRVSAAAVSHAQLGGARLMAGNLPVVPSRASLSASGRAAAPSTIRNGGSDRFFGRSNVARPVSFQQQTANLRQTMQQSRVGAVPAGGRTGGEFGARGGNSTMQRPSAGIVGNRGTNGGTNEGFGSRNGSNQPAQNGGFRPASPAQNNRNVGTPGMQSPRGTASQGGGFRPFTPPAGNARSPEAGFGGSRVESPRGPSQAAPTENRGGFRTFTPPSNNSAPRSVYSAPSNRGSNGSYWNRTAPSSVPRSNSGYSGGGYSGGSSRPQLDMHQPIVRGPSYSAPSRGNYGGGNYGGSRPSPSYGGGSHSAPSHSSGGGGGHAPSGGGGGGHVSGGGGSSGHSSSGSAGHSGHR